METCPPEKWEKEEKKIVADMSKYKISGSSFVWINSTCPDCGTVNWIDMAIDVEACECFKCKKTFWISYEIHEEFKTSLIMSEVFNTTARLSENIFLGMKKPN